VLEKHCESEGLVIFVRFHTSLIFYPLQGSKPTLKLGTSNCSLSHVALVSVFEISHISSVFLLNLVLGTAFVPANNMILS